MAINQISSYQLTQNIIKNLSSQMEQQNTLFEQISSNKKLLKPSDGPVDVTKSITLRAEVNRLGEYESVATSGQFMTNVASAALDDALSVYTRVNEIAISAIDGSKSSSDLKIMAEELEQLLLRLVQVSNTTYQGKYIFGGSQTRSASFEQEVDSGTGKISGVYYKGDNFIQNIKTDDYGTVPLTILGANAGDEDASGVFIDSTTDANAFKTLIELRDKLNSNSTAGIMGSEGLLAEVETVNQNLISGQVRLGITQEALELDRNRIIDHSAEVEQDLAALEAADIAKLILELNNVQNTYEAALTAGGRIMKSSLLNYI